MSDIGDIHLWAGRYDQAIARVREALELEPNYAVAHNVLGMALLKQQRTAEAIGELELAARLEDLPRMLSTLGYAYAVTGRRDDAFRIRQRLEALATTRYVSPFALAVVDTGLGRADSAFAQLERAFAEHSDTMAILRAYPLFESLRGDPRFADLVRRVEAGMRVRWPLSAISCPLIRLDPARKDSPGPASVTYSDLGASRR